MNATRLLRTTALLQVVPAALIVCMISGCHDKQSNSAAPATSESPAVTSPAGCDVNVVPGDRIGDKRLGGEASVKVDVETGKTYCLFGLKLTSASQPADLKAVAGCKESALVGETKVNCNGVALSFTGPTLAFAHITLSALDTGAR